MSDDINALPTRPARKFSSNARSMTGRVSGQQVESSLERDFATLVSFDTMVERWLTQPVTLKYHDANGLELPYTPDSLVVYHRRPDGGYLKPPKLCEIKYEKDLAENCEKYAPKFAAAEAYCADRRWEFTVCTERQIRTPLLENARFLLPYRRRKFLAAVTDPIMTWFSEADQRTVQKLLPTIPESDRLLALAAVWHLVATGRLLTDLEAQKISQLTPLRGG